ncbi:serine hydrolase domain-containing protein [Isoptericola sp. NPDC057653]|uniref:serine hydrolase domain-containing protein n=1 Tax=Isoptericola sp. NPDC057653 TaxID=3346195 RepID=UPI0036CC4B7D
MSAAPPAQGAQGVQGTVAPGFAQVRAAFERALARHPEPVGAQLAVRHHGRVVVDLWAPDTTADTVTGLFSVAKGVAHLVGALAVQDGAVDLARPVAHYWPAFAAEGKGAVTVGTLWSHGAGLVAVPQGFGVDELADDAALAELLAGQRPWWRPGDGYGYHALVVGALVAEVVRRATGATLAELYAERVREPFGVDLHLGLPEADRARLAPVTRAAGAPGPRRAPVPLAEATLMELAFNQHAAEPTDVVGLASDPRVHAGGPSSSGAFGTARGVAALYAAAISGSGSRPALLAASTAAGLATPRQAGRDVVTGEPDHFGAGFERIASRFAAAPAGAFGHSGAAGALGFADPGSGIAYGYARSLFGAGGGAAPENGLLVAAVTRAAAQADEDAATMPR